VSNVGILAEGWDMPSCQTMILARPTRSLTRYIQMAGRVLRPHHSKARALILDHSGTVTRLGFPTDDFPLELDDGRTKLAQSTPKERDAKLPEACLSCSFVKSTHACPSCGFAPERQSNVEVKDGDLVRVRRKSTAAKIDKQDFYSQLLYIAESQGYRHGWVANKYREFFSVWPRGLAEVPKPAGKEVLGFLKHLRIRYVKAKEARHAAD
jgi:superfamily II DNA or RNA helicase